MIIHMEYTAIGKIIKMTGGLYTVRLHSAGQTPAGPLAGQTVECRARGGFRHAGLRPLVGDNAEVSYSDSSVEQTPDGIRPSADRTGLVLSDILPRRNSLIRPPLANLDMMLVVTAAAAPAPDLPTLDKLFGILEHNRIAPVFVVGKRELDPARAEELTDLYRRAGYPAFALSCVSGEGLDALSAYARAAFPGRTVAVSGASGVGKSTLLNTLFPGLSLVTGGISLRIARGKNTTRHTELFPLPDFGAGTYIADTAGFSLLDFEHFDFFGLDDLADCFPEFAPYIGKCRYTGCTHLKEDGCAVLSAVRAGAIAPTRHRSYCELYAILKEKPVWGKK